MIKNKYEISLWEDKLISASEEDSIPEHYEEEKICIIGSDTMTSQARAVEPKLVQNINGTNTLTFKLYYFYVDNETGEKVRNPFLSLLINERKVKCNWEGKWYDFVIKGIQEDSNGKSITYTCSDLYVNELSKTGFNLEFDTELNNNQGSAQELAKKVVEGTDWEVVDGDRILQYIEEPLYKATLKENLKIDDKTAISAGQNIYLFYSVVENEDPYIQFIYNESYETENNSQLLKENTAYAIETNDYNAWVEASISTSTEGKPLISFSDYRGKRLVRQQLQEFNEAVGRNCYVFEKEDQDERVLGFSTVEYKDPSVVLNLISNSKEFVDTNGWRGNLKWQLYPLFYGEEKIPETYSATTYLVMDNGTIFNSGLKNSTIYLEDGLQVGQRYFLRIKAYQPNGDSPSASLISKDSIKFQIRDYFESISQAGEVPLSNNVSYCDVIEDPIVVEYELTNDTSPQEGKTYYIYEVSGYKEKIFSEGEKFKEEISYYEKLKEPLIQLEVRVNNSIPRQDITTGYFIEYTGNPKDEDHYNKKYMARPGIFLSLPACWIQEVQFYERVEGYNGKIIHLGDLDTQSVGTTYYKYFLPSEAENKKEEEIKYLYCGTEKQTQYKKVYEQKDGYVLYEKIRSITAKQSNRFNILQSIAETFECWIRFNIEHDEETGKILYDSGHPKKTITFSEKVGSELGYGFCYGIDLKTISRSIDSNQITTKVIVSPNVNEYAEDGMCEVARSEFNETGENYIYDFGYYISQGLLNGGELNKYLYLPESGESGFYTQLKTINSAYNARVLEITARKTELTKQNSLKTVYEQYVSSAQEQITSLRSQLAQLAGLSTYDSKLVLKYINQHQDFQKAIDLLTTLTTTEHNLESYQDSLRKLEVSVGNLTNTITQLEEENKNELTKKENLEKDFYKRFSRFIQEGSWTSQDYLDENLYYLDAKSIAYTSSRPKISYNISVIRLNALPEFMGKIFNVGDISYIEDTEFFGYVEGKNAWKTPYREQVLISEKTSNFDSPEKDTFTIQNYKTQFEDLFQRITATTQSLQYSTGEYQRASNIVEGKGVINSETLQNSININNELVFKSQNEEIFQDSTGLTLSDKTDPAKKTKLTSGGLFISTDGGVTWKNAVRGEGIATQYLTSGSINTENIAILDGAYPTFRWDKYGLNAFEATYLTSEAGEKYLAGIIPNNYVRFDQFGIYGVNQESETPFNPTKIEEVKKNAFFGLVRDGFFFKAKDDNGLVEISNENSILVKTNQAAGEKNEEIERIRLGKLEEGLYGLRIKDKDGITSLETVDDGKLWLKDSLNIYNPSNYHLTNDKEVSSTKDYYKRNEDKTYTKITSPTGNPSEQNWYEFYNYKIQLGNLTSLSEEKRQVFNANDNFIVYEDGSIQATNGNFSGNITGATGTFSGTIHASSGRIGGLEINGTADGPSFATITDKLLTINIPEISDSSENYGLKITKNTGSGVKTVFGVNEKGDLEFAGNLNGATGTFSGELLAASGSFSGELKAATGSFNGDISAASGTIGGFKITSDSLYSGENSTSSPLILFGKEGKIIANNIELGTGAKIKNYIEFPYNENEKAYIYNPSVENHNGTFIKAGKLELKTNGIIQIGDIRIDGSNETSPQIWSSKWSITSDTATFNNVTAKGGTIENVVFKNSSVQSAGGIMLFKPSGTCEFFSKNTVGEEVVYSYFLNDNDRLQLSVDDGVLIQKNKAVVKSVSDDFKTINVVFETKTIGSELEDKKLTLTITKLYSNNEGRLSDEILIGINSSNVEQFNLFERGLTITAPQIESGRVIYPETPNLYIGDLQAIGKNGYGLYGDNVFLNGTLTTKVQSGDAATYAGVNTLTGTNLFQGSNEKIVFWAGSKDDSDDAIQQAPFKVTDSGNLFATKGEFSDSLFTNSEIYGSDIYAARIFGWKGNKDSGTKSALSIYDTTIGISFKEQNNNGEERTLLSLSQTGFSTGEDINNKFVEILEDSSVKFLGKEFEGSIFKTQPENQSYLKVEGKEIERILSADEEGLLTQTKVFFDENKIVFSSQDSIILEVAEQKTIVPKNFQVGSGVFYSDKMEYREVNNGYDLYISE